MESCCFSTGAAFATEDVQTSQGGNMDFVTDNNYSTLLRCYRQSWSIECLESVLLNALQNKNHVRGHKHWNEECRAVVAERFHQTKHSSGCTLQTYMFQYSLFFTSQKKI